MRPSRPSHRRSTTGRPGGSTDVVPELCEVEYARRLVVSTVGRRVTSLRAPDAWWLRRGTTAEELGAVVVGSRVGAVGRRGKLLTIGFDRGPGAGRSLGIHHGMTGRLSLGGVWAVAELEYASNRDEPAWDRLVIGFGRLGDLTVRDPRRLGGAELDPDLDRLGPDAASITPRQLTVALRGHAPLKARLLDQSRVAGLGNLLVDETLWRAGLAPVRAAGGLSAGEHRRLHRHLRATVDDLLARGGSHTGDLQPSRVRGGHCPRDGTVLRRESVGGRTTFWCAHHQR